jgi:hypothetical protein
MNDEIRRSIDYMVQIEFINEFPPGFLHSIDYIRQYRDIIFFNFNIKLISSCTITDFSFFIDEKSKIMKKGRPVIFYFKLFLQALTDCGYIAAAKFLKDDWNKDRYIYFCNKCFKKYYDYYCREMFEENRVAFYAEFEKRYPFCGLSY